MGYHEYKDRQEFLDNPCFTNIEQKVYGPGYGHKVLLVGSNPNSTQEQNIIQELDQISKRTGIQSSYHSQAITNQISEVIQDVVKIINTNELVLPISTENCFYSTVVLANSLVNHIAQKAPEKTLTFIHSNYNQLIELKKSGAHLLTNAGNVFAGEDLNSNMHYIWNYSMMQPTTTIKSNTDNRNNFYKQAISKLQRDLTFQTQINNKPITIAHIDTFDDFTPFRKHMKCISLALAISYNQANPDTQNHIIANSRQFQEFIEGFLQIHNIDPKSQAIFYDQDGREKYNQLV